ncbi:ubiquitin-conjugating enzyme/RWD-like protein [Melanogaster broomeanus]|nr:ubiquitin-conjugating enzyme/RWD-like protein [Melanogaster broomeanus]
MPPAPSSAMTMKRIHREIADAKKEDLGTITLAPTQDSLYHWKGTIPGPQGSSYEGGVFNVDIQLPPDYPFSAPKVTFSTRIYHMNISDKGGICIDILKQNWSPALSLFKVMLSLSSLLTDPNPHDPLVPSIATEYMRNRAQHDRTARRWTELYARPPAPPPPPQPKSAPTPVPASTSNKSKGKEKAPTLQTHSSGRSGSTAAGGSTSTSTRRQPRSETVTIDDSDDEVILFTSVPSPSVQTGKRRRGDADVVDIDPVEAERTRSRRKVQASSSRLPTSGEVIVIDD